jgi:hypothetical protein
MISAVWVLAVALGLAGCTPQQSDGRDTSPSGTGQRLGAGTGEPLQGRLSDTEKKKTIAKAMPNFQRVVISTDERMRISQGAASTTIAKDAITAKLAALTFNVIQSTAWTGYDPSEQTLDEYRERNDCNLVLLVQGEARQAAQLNNYLSYDGELKGKVVNATTHQIIASTTIAKRGQYSPSQLQAGESALQAAAADLVTYLTDEIARKWEATSLVKLRLTVQEMDHIIKVDDVRLGLQKKAGVYYVSLEKSDLSSGEAEFEVLCRFDLQPLLPTYVDDLRSGSVKVLKVEQSGEVIKARKGWAN